MTFPQWLLVATGAIFVPFGFWALAQPAAVAGMTEVELPSAAALADGRAVYGGLTLGLGAFFLFAARSPSMVRSGLWAAFLTIGAAGMGRATGVLVDGATGPAVFPTLVFEVVLSALAAYALVRGEHRLIQTATIRLPPMCSAIRKESSIA